MRYKALIFDWDGTLLDSEARIVSCFQKAAEDIGLPSLSNLVIRNIIGLGLFEAVIRLFPDLEPLRQSAFVERYRHHYFLDQAPSVLFSGVKETLQSFHEDGYLLAVATGKSRRGLDLALQETGLLPLFAVTRCADETYSKPDPTMLFEILQELSLRTAEAIMVGDTEYDLEMAERARMDRVAVTYGAHEVERLIRWNPLACFQKFSEFRDWLQQQ